MSLLLQGRWANWSINARIFLMGVVFEAFILPGLVVASFLMGWRLSLFSALFSQGIVAIGVLYLRVRMTEMIREQREGQSIASMLRRIPI